MSEPSNVISLFWWKYHRPAKPKPKSTEEKIRGALEKYGSFKRD